MVCGTEFVASRRAKYCGERCKKRQQRGPLQPTVRECGTCHGSFSATHATRYCSDACRAKARSKRHHGAKRTGLCARCGSPMWVSKTSLPQGQATCLTCRREREHSSTDDQIERQREYNRKAKAASRQRMRAEGRSEPRHPSRMPKPLPQWNCQVCGVLVTGHCNTRYRTHCERHRLSPTMKGHRKRAIKYGVEYEYIDSNKVHEHDGWMCGICHEPVDPDLAYPDPMSASIDHVIPMARGGPHLYSNVQCSHWLCNVRKSDNCDAPANPVANRRETPPSQQVTTDLVA